MEFELQYVLCKEDYLRYWRMFRRLRYPMMVVFWGFAVLYFLYVLFLYLRMIIKYHYWSVSYICMMTVCVLVPLYLLFRDKLLVAIRMKNSYTTNRQMNYSFEDERFVYTTEGVEERYSYKIIQEIYHIDGVFYLFFEKKSAIILPERAFVSGHPAAFTAFLEEKTGVQVQTKIRRRKRA